jgi:Protein of unknown function (DUF4242)
LWQGHFALTVETISKKPAVVGFWSQPFPPGLGRGLDGRLCRRDDRLRNWSAENLKEGVMKKYMIEREIPKIGTLEREQLQEGAAKSNQVLRQLGPDIQWLESFVTSNKMYCMYLATDEKLIYRHAELSGFPASKVTEIGRIIDPTTAGR